MRILVHTCCGPCFLGPERALNTEGHEVVGYFYNPNVHPYREFRKRLGAVRELVEKHGRQIIMDKEYGLDLFVERTWPLQKRGEKRCPECYAMRLEAAAKKAADGGFDAFTTTLLVSPHQDHEAVRRAGEAAAAAHDVRYMHADFRPHYKWAHEESERLGLYHQGYCGCVWSERERYDKKFHKGKTGSHEAPADDALD